MASAIERAAAAEARATSLEQQCNEVTLRAAGADARAASLERQADRIEARAAAVQDALRAEIAALSVSQLSKLDPTSNC